MIHILQGHTYPFMIDSSRPLLTSRVHFVITPLPVSILGLVQVTARPGNPSDLREWTGHASNSQYRAHSSDSTLYQQTWCWKHYLQKHFKIHLELWNQTIYISGTFIYIHIHISRKHADLFLQKHITVYQLQGSCQVQPGMFTNDC